MIKVACAHDTSFRRWTHRRAGARLWVLLRAVLGRLRQDVDIIKQAHAVHRVDVQARLLRAVHLRPARQLPI